MLFAPEAAACCRDPLTSMLLAPDAAGRPPFPLFLPGPDL